MDGAGRLRQLSSAVPSDTGGRAGAGTGTGAPLEPRSGPSLADPSLAGPSLAGPSLAGHSLSAPSFAGPSPARSEPLLGPGDVPREAEAAQGGTQVAEPRESRAGRERGVGGGEGSRAGAEVREGVEGGAGAEAGAAAPLALPLGAEAVLGELFRECQGRVGAALQSQQALDDQLGRLAAELDRMLERLPTPVTSPQPSRIADLRKRTQALTTSLRRILHRVAGMKKLLLERAGPPQQGAASPLGAPRKTPGTDGGSSAASPGRQSGGTLLPGLGPADSERIPITPLPKSHTPRQSAGALSLPLPFPTLDMLSWTASPSPNADAAAAGAALARRQPWLTLPEMLRLLRHVAFPAPGLEPLMNQRFHGQ